MPQPSAGGAFHWGKGALEIKATVPGGKPTTGDGWQLLGFLQFLPQPEPSPGSPSPPLVEAFLHRTMNKFRLEDAPWPVEVLTGPMPQR